MNTSMDPNPNMTYEELREQVTELLREMYHPSDQILKEDVPKVIQLFATLCAEVTVRAKPARFNIPVAKKEYIGGLNFNNGIDTYQNNMYAAIAQLTTKPHDN